jgi:hypothetical protein
MPYIIGLLILIILLLYRRSRKKKKKREKLEAKLLKKRAVNVNTFAVERDLLDLEPTNLPASPDTDWLTGLDLDGEDW